MDKWYELMSYEDTKKFLDTNLKTMSRTFIATGYALKYVRDNEMYKQDGYKSIWEFAEARYGLKMSTASRWMEMNTRFSKDGNSPEIAEEYKGFGKSQLQEMLYIPETDYAMLRPETTKEEMRELAQFNRENENSPNRLLNWQQSEDEAVEAAILDFFKERKDSLNKLYTSEAYKKNDIAEMAEIVYRSQKRKFRTKQVFMVLYEDQIYIKDSNNEQHDLTWEEFFCVMRKIFDASAAGERTWENYFEPKAPEQIPGQDSILEHPEYMPEGQLHKKRFPACVYMQGSECIAEDCEGCSKKEEYKRQERERTELTEDEAITLFAKYEPRKLEKILQICRENQKDRAKAVQKYVAPYGFSDVNCGGYDAMYYTFAQGLRISLGKKKIFMTYQNFVKRLVEKYASELRNTVTPAIAPAQNTCLHRPEYSCTLTEAQKLAEGDGVNCNLKCCWNCSEHGLCGYECNSSAHRPNESTTEKRCEIAAETKENAAEIAAVPEEWPRDLQDIPVPSVREIEDILREAEEELKAYLECEGLPERMVTKQQLITGGLRLIRNLVLDIEEAEA